VANEPCDEHQVPAETSNASYSTIPPDPSTVWSAQAAHEHQRTGSCSSRNGRTNETHRPGSETDVGGSPGRHDGTASHVPADVVDEVGRNMDERRSSSQQHAVLPRTLIGLSGCGSGACDGENGGAGQPQTAVTAEVVIAKCLGVEQVDRPKAAPRKEMLDLGPAIEADHRLTGPLSDGKRLRTKRHSQLVTLGFGQQELNHGRCPRASRRDRASTDSVAGFSKYCVTPSQFHVAHAGRSSVPNDTAAKSTAIKRRFTGSTRPIRVRASRFHACEAG
jgi:hypothetical protein